MTGKEMLSQEEIDALLRQDSIQKEEKAPDVHDYLSPLEIDALGEIGNITFGSASTALSSLLRQKVDITTPEVDIVMRNALDKEFPHPHVAVHVQYTEGFQGINLLVLRMADARIIADLMLGGDGLNPADLGEMEISACQEAMNQMMGSAATSMSTIFNKVVNISPPGINILDLPAGEGKNNLPEEEVLVRVSFRLTIGNLLDSHIMQLIPVSFARNMINILLGNGESTSTETNEGRPIEHEPPQGLQANEQVKPAETGQSVQQNISSQSYVNPNRQHDTTPSMAPQYIGGQSGMSRSPNVQPVQFSSFDKVNPISQQNEQNLNLLLDIPLQVTVELGRTKKLIKEILELAPGSIIELDKLAGEPVDILVNNKLVAKGEVVVIEENFGVRVTEIISQWERLAKLQ